jgi:hypothetical protein
MMKKFFLILTFILFSIFDVAMTQPILTFPHGTTYDWGIVKPKDNPLNAEIVIGNSGTDTLIITKVQPTCGCTNAPLLKDKLAPGETTSMMVTLSILNYDGPIHKIIKIFSNDPNQSTAEINLNANIKRDIFVTPSAFLSFTDTKVGETSKQMLVINNNSDKDIKIKVGSVSPQSLQLKIREGQIIKKGGTYPLEVSITPNEAGILKGKILLLTNNSDFPEIPIFVFGDIKPSPLFIGQ